jgi:hypothetical protein
MAVAVRHEELGQGLAYGGDENIGAVRLDASDQLVVGRLQIGKQLAGLAEIELQPPVEGSIDGVRRREGSARASSSDFASVKTSPA